MAVSQGESMTWRVPFVDFPKQFSQQEELLMKTIHETLSQGDLVMRRQMYDFEDNLAAFCGTRFAVGVSNCTDAIRLVCHALGVGPGDQAVSVAHTFVATISPFKLAGAEPVLVDVGDDHLIDPKALEAAVSERTRVVLPVHLNGRICDMEAVGRVAQSVGAVVIEDAAQALGATYRGEPAGSFGLAGVFSFYPAKLLGAFGDAGAVVTDDEALADEIRELRDHGRRGKTELARWGYNCRLDNLQAAVLDVRLTMLPSWIERRRELAARYDDVFRTIDRVATLPGPTAEGDYVDVYQNYPVLVPRRDEFVSRLNEHGIETLVSWPVPMHHQTALGLSHLELPMTERISRDVVSLPMFPELEDWQVDYVAEAVASLAAEMG
jgi:dTDP-4-amino-4,6-dideoxygalactose transaminase